MLTPTQRRRIHQVIRDGHLAFLAEMFGPTSIDRDDYVRLKSSGAIRGEKTLPQDVAYAAHSLGALAAVDQIGALAAMKEEAHREAMAPDVMSDDFWRQLRDDPQVVTEAEREAVEMLRDRVGQKVRALGARMDEVAGHVIVAAEDELRRRRLVDRKHLADADRVAAAAVGKKIRSATGDLKRDWLRAAYTEIHNTVEEAKAIVIAHRSGERDPRVYKVPRPTACSYCRLLYLKPDGVTPRVFKLSALLANGSNVGRKANRPTFSGRSRTEWKPVVGAAHPFCACSLHFLAPGMGFGKGGKLIKLDVDKSVEVEDLDKSLANHECR